VKHLAARLGNRGFSVISLSGELSQAERTNALQAMRDGRSRVCVATDVAARGIDLPNLDLVIHADLPMNPDTLLHRSGRTGRAGRKGVCVLVVPVRRLSAANRVLGYANVEGTVRAAPAAADIDARYREQILDAAAGAAAPDEGEAAFVAELIARVPAEQLAVAYLRQQLGMRPAPEDISPMQLPAGGKTARGAPTGAARPPRPERRDMTGSAWFTLSAGRRNRAEPRWILPLICKAGDITREDVGSIKIFDEETRFEISADKAAAFAERIARRGRGEDGVTITPAGEQPRAPRRSAWEPALGDAPKTGETEPKARPRKPARKAWAEEGDRSGKPRKAGYKEKTGGKYKPANKSKGKPRGKPGSGA
jgi:ATP-dependent RNA helicase DeaD